MKEVRITAKLYKDGTVKIDVGGVQGKQCLELTEQLESALGKITDRTEKPEINERPVIVTTTTSQRVKN